MKILALLSLFLGVQSTFAADSGDSILTKMASAGARPPKYRESRLVEVMPTGEVEITNNKGFKSKTVAKGSLSAEVMKSIVDCKKQVSKMKEPKAPNCAGGPATSYYVGEKLISIKMCGEVKTMDLSCVDSMIKLLDRL
jgi:hypothetical protein